MKVLKTGWFAFDVEAIEIYISALVSILMKSENFGYNEYSYFDVIQNVLYKETGNFQQLLFFRYVDIFKKSTNFGLFIRTILFFK